MKKLIVAALLFSAQGVFAGTGGSVSCNSGSNIVAIYSWFHSVADSYSTLTVFVGDGSGDFKQYDASNERALQALTVKTNDGKELSVLPDLRNGVCIISEK